MCSLVVQGRDQLRFSVKCSFLEIYNENVTDLLRPSSGNLSLREDMKRGCYVDNLSEEIVLNGKLIETGFHKGFWSFF